MKALVKLLEIHTDSSPMGTHTMSCDSAAETYVLNIPCLEFHDIRPYHSGIFRQNESKILIIPGYCPGQNDTEAGILRQKHAFSVLPR